MPSKEQLEEWNDQLRAENKSLSERLAALDAAAGEIAALEDENQRLRDSLRHSEQERQHAAQMLGSLTAAQHSMEQLFRTKEETALQRLEIEARQVAAEKQKTDAKYKQMRDWLTEIEHGQAGYQVENQRLRSEIKQTAQALRNEQQRLERRDEDINELKQETRRLEAQNRTLQRLPKWFKAAQWTGDWLSAYPWFWLGVIGICLGLWTIVWVVQSVLDWMWPSSGPLLP